MAPLNAEAALRRLMETRLPAVNTAGCHFSPVQGLTGESWRIDGVGITLLARQHSAEKRALGVSRRREARVLRRCAPGLGPWVFAQNNQWFILEWLEGDVVTDTEFAALNQRGELAAMAAELHRRPLSGYRLDLRRQFRRYWQQLDRRRLTLTGCACSVILRSALPRPLRRAAAHGHPSGQSARHRRRAAADRLGICRRRRRGAGYRRVVSRQRLVGRPAAALLQHYARRGYHDVARLQAQVRRWLPWVDYLMLLWFEVRWQQSGDAEFCAGARRCAGDFVYHHPNSERTIMK